MNAPLSRYLTCFATQDLVEPIHVGAVATGPDGNAGAADLDARLEDARRAARADAEQEHATAVATLVAAHEAALTEARETWCACEASAVAARLDEAFARLRDELATRIADVLRPLLAKAAAEHTVAMLVDALGLLLADPKHPVVTLRGPADLLEAVRTARGSDDGLALIVDEDGVEVVCIVDGTHIETRLAATLAALAATEA